MALSITRREDHSEGSLRGSSARITFDSSYAVGGESLTPNDLGLGQLVGDVVLPQGEQGYVFQWDRDNEKIIVLGASAPQLVIEEVVAFSSDVGTLRYPPAYIVAIVDSTNNVAYRTLPTGEAAVDNVSVAVNFISGVITKHADETDSDTIVVTYFPQRSGTFFSLENMVIDENVTALVAGVNLEFRAAAIQHIYNNDTNVALTESTPGDACGDGEVGVDINNSGATTIVTHVDEDADILKVTYLKFSGLDSQVAFTDDTEIALSTGDYNFTTDGTFLVDQLQVPGYGTILVGEESNDTQTLAVWAGPGETEADDIASWTPATNVIETVQSAAMTHTQISWLTVQLNVAESVRPDRLVEIEDGRDLSSVVIDVYARGR